MAKPASRSTPSGSGATPTRSRRTTRSIIGGGGHGLATAYYLAKNHGMTNIAILEKGWLAGGNMARNTTIIRSNYLWDESAAIYEHALKLWELLPEELDYDFLFSQRGVLNLAHTLQDVRDRVRRVEANRSTVSTPSGWTRGGARTLPDRQHLRRHALPGPGRDLPAARRHRQARPRGVGVRPQPVTRWASTSSRTARSPASSRTATGSSVSRPPAARIHADNVGLVAAGHTSVLAEMAGFRLPVQSHPLQALVSELYEPVHPTVVMSNHVHVYVSQAHKGELVMGAGVDHTTATASAARST